jgi:hypothetical protein
LKSSALRREVARSAQPDSSDSIVAELIAALAPHPGGLRRWSVMRAIRKKREAVSRDIPLKFEADIERTFRQFCSNAADAGTRKIADGDALFYRPAEKAGEVWALHPLYRRPAPEPQAAAAEFPQH